MFFSEATFQDIRDKLKTYEGTHYYETTKKNLFLNFLLMEGSIKTNFLKGKTIKLRAVEKLQPNKITLKHFTIFKKIGTGGFSKVYLCQYKGDGQFYALKLIEKEMIVKSRKKKIILNERNIMKESDHPFIIKMKFAFETERYLGFVLEYCAAGELFSLLKKYRTMTE